MNELSRFLRHAIAPLALLLVERGWLPEAAQGDFIEATVIGLSFAVPIIWSKLSDLKILKDAFDGIA